MTWKKHCFYHRNRGRDRNRPGKSGSTTTTITTTITIQIKKMSTFTHLHTHSYYSLLDGVNSPEELLLAAKKQGMQALALTDHNGLYGAVEFYEKAREYNIKPLIGAEITLDDGYALILLVKDQTGYRNLCQIISTGHLEGGHLNFKCALATVKKYKQGLIVLSGGNKGKITSLLKNHQLQPAIDEARLMHKLFAENFYLEMQHFTGQDTLSNLRLRDIAAEQKLPLVATNDVHFTVSKDWNIRRLLHAIDQNSLLENVTSAGISEQFLKPPALMQTLFRAFPEAVSNTQKIVRQCRFDFELGRPIFPSVELPRGESSFSYLWKCCFTGATQRYQPLTQEVLKRLEYELKIIHELGFSEYFLIVKEIVDFCRREHIPCVGRGSAADSLVSYVLGITQVCPLRHNLYFERFLNPQRKDPPDIDLDLCWKNRDRVLNHVYEKYGQHRTAMICTFNTFQGRSAIRDIAKTHGLPEDEIAKITKHLPFHAIDRLEEVINTLPEMRELRRNLPLYEEIMRLAQRLADFPRHLSIHPGGVLIAPDKITHYTALEVAGKGIVIAQYDMYAIEKLGLVKMDLLGVRSLSVITDCLKAIKNNQAHIHKAKLSLVKTAEELSPLDLRAIPENDAAVTAYIRSGQTMACFQLESPAMRGLLKKMQIEDVNDVITAVALIRPGASGSGMKEVYIKRRAGLEAVSYVHPSLAGALEETYGVIIYQEQVLKVAHYVAGLPLDKADVLRRAMTKARTKKEFKSVYQDFIDGARQRGLSAEQAETVWQFLFQFVGYGFNKAHSATYGTIAYQTAYLKHYFPQEYMCAVLNNHGGFYARMAYIEEARRLGIKLLPPDINHSRKQFTCEQKAIRCGLEPVFELSERTQERIITECTKTPFKDLYDFLRRTLAGEKETLHLIKAGALASLNASAPQLLLETNLFFKNNKKRTVTEFVAGGTSLAPYNSYHKILNELEMLDFAVTDHPLALFDDYLASDGLVTSNQLEKHKDETIRFCGWLVTSRRVSTSSNKYMKFLTLEDRFGLCEAVLFSDAYLTYGHLIRTHGPYLITGKVQSRLPGEANLIAEKVELVEMNKKELEVLLQKKTPAMWEGY
jgi:DNA-directed DNA polymerase III PolC